MKTSETMNNPAIFTDEYQLALRKRNQERAEAAKVALGTVYLCHPVNHIKRKETSAV